MSILMNDQLGGSYMNFARRNFLGLSGLGVAFPLIGSRLERFDTLFNYLSPPNPAPPEAPRHIIIDTDPGVDDAVSILLAFRSPEVIVDAVTVVAGNVVADVG